LSGIVGSVVLPVLGAVPDGAIVLFSGLGDDAQDQLSVGVGALAGSTIMLLTIPWFLSVVAGRVTVDSEGKLCYAKKVKLDPQHSWNVYKTGVDCNNNISIGGCIMLLTTISYFIIQGPAFFVEGDSSAEVAEVEHDWALAGLLICTVLFFAYLWYQWHLANSGDEMKEKKHLAIIRKAIDSGKISLVGALASDFVEYADQLDEEAYQAILEERTSDNNPMNFFNKLGMEKIRSGLSQRRMSPQKAADEENKEDDRSYGSNGETSAAATDKTGLNFLPEDKKKRLREILKYFFNKYDKNGDNSMDSTELTALFKDLGERIDQAEMLKLFNAFDTDKNGIISFEEFVDGTAMYMVTHKLRELKKGSVGNLDDSLKNLESAQDAEDDQGGEEEDEDEEIPDDLLDLPADEQQRRIKTRSFTMMGLGTLLVLIFSDPMVDVLTALGERTGISAFYISFVLAPLASNASELLASYNYALKKTSNSIMISLSALQGAACMNNTFCLGVFMALIFFKGLAWEFSAETLSILFVQIVMAVYSFKDKHLFIDAILILTLYPISIVLVAGLEAIGWD